MDDFLTLLGMLCGGSLLVVPVISLLLALSARKRLTELERRLNDLEGEVARARARALQESVASAGQARALGPLHPPPPRRVPEAPRPAEAAAVTPPPPPPADPVAPPPPQPADENALATWPPQPDKTPEAAPPAPPVSPAPPPRPTPSPKPASPPLRFEQIAIRALSVLMGLSALAAAFFFYDLAVERGFITPGVRYALGLGLGLALLVGAEVLWKRDYRVPAAAVSGTGIGVLYAALYAGVTRYELVGVPPTFALMAAVTVVATLLAVRHDSLFLAVLGALGGYGTPIMLSTGQNKAVALFTYVALLDAGLLIAASRRRWPALVALAGLSTLALELGWAASFHTSDQLPVGLAAPLILGIGFGLVALRQRDHEPTAWAAAGAAASAAIGVLPFLVPLNPPIDGPQDLWQDAAPTVGALAVLACALGLQALARLRRWPGYAAGMAALVGVPMLTLIGSHLASNDPHAWPMIGLLLAVPLATLGLAPRPWGAPVALLVSAGIYAITTPLLLLHGDGAPVPWLAALVGAAGLALLAALMPATGRGTWPPLVGLLVSAVATLCIGNAEGGAGGPLGVLMISALFAAFFLVLPFALERRDPELARQPLPWIAAALAGPSQFFQMYDAWEDAWGTAVIGVLPVALGLSALGAVVAIVRRRRAEAGDRDLALFTAVALLFLAAAIPIQLSDEWLTLGWALEVAALAWARDRLTHKMLTPFALVLAALVSVRLLLNVDALDYHEVEGPPVFNWISYTWGVPALCLLYAAAKLPDAPGWAKTAMRFSAIGMLFALVNLQVSHTFASGGELTFFSEDFAEEMTRSLCWGGFGLLVLVGGVVTRNRTVRILAFLFLLLAAGKVFLSDLSNLGGLARVGSLLGLSVFLLAAATLFRWLDKKLEAETPEPGAS